jgi:hypothetical protein
LFHFVAALCFVGPILSLLSTGNVRGLAGLLSNEKEVDPDENSHVLSCILNCGLSFSHSSSSLHTVRERMLILGAAQARVSNYSNGQQGRAIVLLYFGDVAMKSSCCRASARNQNDNVSFYRVRAFHSVTMRRMGTGARGEHDLDLSYERVGHYFSCGSLWLFL